MTDVKRYTCNGPDDCNAPCVVLVQASAHDARVSELERKLKVAVEALSQYAGVGSDNGPLALVGKTARDALSAIGSLPEG